MDDELNTWSPDERRRMAQSDHRTGLVVNTMMIALTVAAGLGVLYGLVRFVKWAWG